MNTKQLKTIVDNAYKFQRKPSIYILECILFDKDTATYTDLETWVTYTIPNCGGKYTYWREELRELCIAHPNTEIEFREDGIYLPNGNRYKMDIETDEYPKIPEVVYGGLLLTTYAQSRLRELVPMLPNPKNEPFKTNMYDILVKQGTAYATDGHMLGWRSDIGLGELTGYIPPQIITMLDKKAEYSLAFNDRWCHIWNKEVSYKRERPEGTKDFPNMEGIFPDYKDAVGIYISTALLIKYLKKIQELAKVIKQSFTYVKFTPTQLIWEDVDYDKELIQEVDLPEFDTFALSVPFLLKVIDPQIFVTFMEFVNPNRPVRVNGNNIIMPIALNSL